MGKHIPTTPDDSHDETLMRFVLGELDPAEMVAFKSRMQHDENLFIEAEALRQTLRRLDSLPLVNAPGHILENVLNGARPRPSLLYRMRFVAVAAALLAAALVSFYQLRSGSREAAPKIPVASDVKSTGGQGSEGQANWQDRKQVVTIDQVTQNSDSANLHPRLKPVTGPAATGASVDNVQLTRSN